MTTEEMIMNQKYAINLMEDLCMEKTGAPMRLYVYVCEFCLPKLESDDQIIFRHIYKPGGGTYDSFHNLGLSPSEQEKRKRLLLKTIRGMLKSFRRLRIL